MIAIKLPIDIRYYRGTMALWQKRSTTGNTAMYSANVQHYDDKTQSMATFKRKQDAMRFVHQQAEIAKGYNKRTGFIGEMFVVFADDDTYATKMWVSKAGK